MNCLSDLCLWCDSFVKGRPLEKQFPQCDIGVEVVKDLEKPRDTAGAGYGGFSIGSPTWWLFDLTILSQLAAPLKNVFPSHLFQVL